MTNTLPDYAAQGYELEELLGTNPEGGRTAYRARRIDDGELVMIKRFSFAGSSSSWDGYKAHEREIAMLEELVHPRIPAYLGDFQTEDGFCLVQAWCPAPPMSSRKSWSPKQVVALARSVLELLVFLQDRMPPMVHRDIKPANILVDDDGNAYLVDFGLARADRAEATTIAVGTPGFMPPEQLLGHEINEATDLYAVGACLICALTGTPSVKVGTLVDATFTFDLDKLPTNLSDDFRQWLAQMVAPDRKARFGSARQALEALDDIGTITGGRRKKKPAPAAADGAPKTKTPRSRTPKKSKKPRNVPDPGQRAQDWQRERKKRGLIGIVAAVGLGLGILTFTLVIRDNPNLFKEGDAPDADVLRARSVVCNKKMTWKDDITMTQQYPAIIAEDGCNLTVRGATVRGHFGIRVKGGKVKLDRVDIENKAEALEIDGEKAVVTVVDSKLNGGHNAVDLRKGKLSVRSSTLTSEKTALSTSGGKVTVKQSTLTGGTRGLAAYATVVDVKETQIDAPTALSARANTKMKLDDGEIQGGIFIDEGSEIRGLSKVKVKLGKLRTETWPSMVCQPIRSCLVQVGTLGEFVADIRAPIDVKGRVGKLEFIQTKLDDKVVVCIEDKMVGMALPDPDGKAHTVRCTTNGTMMAGGGGMVSVDYKME